MSQFTVATDRPARRATSVMLMDVNDFLKTFTLHPLRVTVPAELFCASNGTLVSDETRGARRTLHWRVASPISNYNLALNIAPYAVLEESFGKDLKVAGTLEEQGDLAGSFDTLERLLRDRDESTPIAPPRLLMLGPDKGDGSLARTRRVAEDLGVAERITFTGWVPKEDVPELLAGADVFLNTTDADNAPVSVTEAMACGLCVVSTDAGGLPDLIADGETGLLVGRDDAGEMAAAVERVLSEEGLAGRLSSAARRAACARDWSNVLPTWQRLLIDNARDGA